MVHFFMATYLLLSWFFRWSRFFSLYSMCTSCNACRKLHSLAHPWKKYVDTRHHNRHLHTFPWKKKKSTVYWYCSQLEHTKSKRERERWSSYEIQTRIFSVYSRKNAWMLDYSPWSARIIKHYPLTIASALSPFSLSLPIALTYLMTRMCVHDASFHESSSFSCLFAIHS